MEVFIVEVDRVWNGEKMDYGTQVYSTKEKAVKALKEIVDDIKKYCKRDGWTIVCDNDDYFYAYLEDDYPYNHTEAAVRRLEVL